MDKSGRFLGSVLIAAIVIIIAITFASIYSIRKIDIKQSVHLSDIQNSDRLPVVQSNGEATTIKIVYDNVGNMGVWDKEQINVRFAEPISEYYSSQKDTSKLVSIAILGVKEGDPAAKPYQVKAIFADGKSEMYDVLRANGELSWVHFPCGFACPYPDGFVHKYPRVIRN